MRAEQIVEVSSWHFYRPTKERLTMQSSSTPDFGKFFEDIKTVVTERLKPSAAMSNAQAVSDQSLRKAILSTLLAGSKNGHKIREAIATASAGTFVPAESRVFAALDALTVDGLVSFSIKAEKKTYKLTEEGKAWLETQPIEAPEQAETNARAENRLASRAELGKASIQLARAITAVTAVESTEKHNRATELVEATTKSLFALLGEEAK
jgi:DNA-binding PadR family transcriptional regulator